MAVYDASQLEKMKETFTIGIIGLGDMGRLYANVISKAGWKVNACDTPDKTEELKKEFAPTSICIMDDGFAVSRASDYIIYSVEAEKIDAVVGKYGPATKMGAIVGGQTSCKTPEIAAFEKYLPEDVQIISCHSLHGPAVNPKSQPLIIIRHRASDEAFAVVNYMFQCFGSSLAYLSAGEHDRITADTQAVTHAAFLTMGAAWHSNQQYPWEINRWCGGIENIKMNLSLRIYSSKWHVYAGLAILNPYARKQIKQYAASVTDLYKLAVTGRNEEFERRVRAAGIAVFGEHRDHNYSGLLLSDDLLDQYSISNVPNDKTVPNSHLSILAIVDSWAKLGIKPQKQMICSTPLFRLWVGVAEYIFRQPEMLDRAIKVMLRQSDFCSDDLEFVIAARSWSDCVENGDFDTYKKRFLKTKEYFRPRFEESRVVCNAMISKLMENLHK
ncbi:prephenate dehydrogenase Tyr1 [Schizosaccharomyces japonicus yFS275]|uniref:Prephenate dehydrogenase [NADP(+)] n=1 Tax=Schizosaccharomyces japonicus (strain yFS275 / FY16936) TaxID=402676 RepID=B6K7E3_SCHJY|nr:prephenate dehydrogenase Tyr1 [Schizosaccharomyces japonicus yFS275]EEB09447.2 prephenate dehydrogenase Tyr1 [Schizosaccharomyces japonicus yFS275]